MMFHRGRIWFADIEGNRSTNATAFVGGILAATERARFALRYILGSIDIDDVSKDFLTRLTFAGSYS